MKEYDLIVIGAGPAGSSCAALCARSGLRVLLLESSRFPRDKVCGDCLNPAVWPALDLLGVSDRVRKLPKSSPSIIRFSASGHHSIELPLPKNPGELVIRRRDFDALLVERAQEMGALFQDGTPITSLHHSNGLWEVTTSLGTTFKGLRIVGADGRNSAVARQLRMLSSPLRDDRIGLQTHIPHPIGYDGALEMHLYRHGYGGIADLGEGLANLCLVSNAGAMRELRKEAENFYHLNSAIAWRSITPIARAKARVAARNGIFLCGDAARVVEPFTGEGISYALRSGSLLARFLSSRRDYEVGDLERRYIIAHRQIYEGKLAVNLFTRFLSQHPKFAHFLAPHLLRSPSLLSHLVHTVIS